MSVCVCVFVEGGGHTDTKTVCQTVSVGVKNRNTQCRACGKLSISKSKISNFELSTKCILIKNLNQIKQFLNLIFFYFILFFLIFLHLFLLFFLFIFFLNFYFFFYLFFFILFFYFYFFDI